MGSKSNRHGNRCAEARKILLVSVYVREHVSLRLCSNHSKNIGCVYPSWSNLICQVSCFHHFCSPFCGFVRLSLVQSMWTKRHAHTHALIHTQYFLTAIWIFASHCIKAVSSHYKLWIMHHYQTIRRTKTFSTPTAAEKSMCNHHKHWFELPSCSCSRRKGSLRYHCNHFSPFQSGPHKQKKKRSMEKHERDRLPAIKAKRMMMNQTLSESHFL